MSARPVFKRTKPRTFVSTIGNLCATSENLTDAARGRMIARYGRPKTIDGPEGTIEIWVLRRATDAERGLP